MLSRNSSPSLPYTNLLEPTKSYSTELCTAVLCKIVRSCIFCFRFDIPIGYFAFMIYNNGFSNGLSLLLWQQLVWPFSFGFGIDVFDLRAETKITI